MEAIEKVDWMHDFYPDDHKYFTFLKKVFRHEFRKNGYRRISTPIVEKSDLFKNVYGETNIFSDKLYSFEWDDWEKLSLRPDAAIWVLRAYMDGGLEEEIQPVYLYHIDRYFRKDGFGIEKLKEFYLIGWEIIGERDPILDVQQIYINYIILNKIGFEGAFNITINSFWNQKELDKYIEELKAFYENKKHLLSEKGKEYLKKNPIMLLTLQGEDEKILASQTPSINKFLKKDSKSYYAKIKKYLDILWVPYQEDHTLVHPLQYYNNSIWTIALKENKQRIVMGGRYDSIGKKMGYEEDISASGFFLWVDKLIAFLKEKDIQIKNKDKIDLYFVQLWDEAKEVVLPLSLEARAKGINTLSSLGTPSLKEQMLKAQRIDARFIVIVGVMEARNGKFQVRNMEDGTQEEVIKEKLIDYIIEKIGKESLDFYDPSRDLLMGSK